MKKIISLLIFWVLSTSVYANEEREACVKYEKEYGWSKGYKVMANVLSGSDLNEAVKSYTRFKSFATYGVVFWGEGQASIFELKYSYGTLDLPMFEQIVEDQEGRKWKIKEGHDFCY